MKTPELGDTVGILGKIIEVPKKGWGAAQRPYVRVETTSDQSQDSFLIYTDQLAFIETPEEATACAD